ncbi:N-formylglutamate deformylase [Thalassotalea aquiviva]|uniref:N-formylglutamate deformylase n=1 Tax=Thalassotalea aquiviva TaxID=3242415 RepID=UPI00352BA68A
MSAPVFSFSEGHIPLLISMPHNGVEIPDAIQKKMTKAGLSVADTDWYMDYLYDFAGQLGATIIKPTYSRYVIDLNRNPNGIDLYPGANSTELCPTTNFAMEPLYKDGYTLDQAEIDYRINTYWQPYHDKIATTLAQMHQQFGKAMLLDAHSIASRVPRFFQGQLPDFNFGTNDGASCDIRLLNMVTAIDYAPYTSVANGRFKGGYITRAYAKPENNIHTLQLELSQRTYMDESSNTLSEEKAIKVKKKLVQMVTAIADFSQVNYV